MKFQVAEEDGIVVGFNLDPNGQSEDEAFCREFSGALARNTAKILITNKGIAIENRECSNRFIDGLPCRYDFEISDEDIRLRLKAFLESSDTQPAIRTTEAWGPKCYILFGNKRLDRIQRGIRYPGDKRRSAKRKMKKYRKHR